MDWAVRAIGIFYVVAGAVALRQMAFNWRLEFAYAKTFPTAPTERAADIILTIGSALVLVSGLALACLHVWTVPAFVACWGVQAGYLLWAQRWNPPRNDEVAGLRRQTLHAFAAYTVATAVVMALRHVGML